MSNKLEGFDVMGAVTAQDVDQAFWINLVISIILFLSVVVPMLYFAWKYRADKVKNEEVENITHNTTLEIAWTLIPTALLMVLFYYGYTSMKALRTMPDESKSLVVNVIGSKWKWEYVYPPNKSGYVHKIGGGYLKPVVDEHGNVIKEGSLGVSALYVPEDTNVILKMTAPLKDVIHSYYVPAFRMKEDVVPGRITKQWFNAKKGTYDVECAEYCGQDHSAMYSQVVVLPKAEFEKWFESKDYTPKGAPKADGAYLFKQKGCVSCHGYDAKGKSGQAQDLTVRMSKAQVLDVIKHGQHKLNYPMGEMPANTVDEKAAEKLAEWIASGPKGTPPTEFAACAPCHGADGKGNGGMAPNLVEYDHVLIKHVMEHGKTGIIGYMPAYMMTDKEVDAIANYLKSLKSN